MKNQPNQGFTLLELSIVLMIVTVIVAGTLVGRSLIASSRLQTVMTDANNYITAVNNFKATYQALPGDYADAETQWGTTATSTCPLSGGSTAPPIAFRVQSPEFFWGALMGISTADASAMNSITGTCNGTGDGRVGPTCDSGAFSTTNQFEVFRVWDHLNHAGLTAIKTTGIADNMSLWSFTAGRNVPAGSLDGSAFSLMWLDNPTQCSNTWGLIPSSGSYGNSLIFGVASANGTGTSDPVLKPEEAEAIDRKTDDGIPNTGNIRSFGTNYNPNCTLHPAGYIYNTTNTTRACSLIFLTNQ